MISSMTGYAQDITENSCGRLTWELRSINHRYLEFSFRLPEVFRDAEFSLREMARGMLGRGKIECILQVVSQQTAAATLHLNMPVVKGILTACEEITMHMHDRATISLLDIIRWPGVMQTGESDHAEVLEYIKQGFSKALTKLQQARCLEGEALLLLIDTKIDAILNHVVVLRRDLPRILEQQLDKMRNKITELAVALDQNRFEQECVYLAQRFDITEELERLQVHANEMRHTCSTGGAVGRKLDFLLQEMNREANTLGAKAVTSGPSLAAVEMKVLIEQIREQVQNIE